MTTNQLISRVLRPLVIVAGVVPAVLLVLRLMGVGGDLGANPAEELEHSTGFTALWMLLGSLAMTPLRRVTGLAAFTQLRKPLGLWAWAYGMMHLGCYLVFDQSLLWGEIGADIIKRPYITVGFTALVILTILAATSPDRVVARLGGRRWKSLHRWVYLAGALGVFHFLWLVKLDITRPSIAAGVLVLLLLLRLDRSAPSRAPARLASEP